MALLTFENDVSQKMGVHILPTKKFKTNTIEINIRQELKEDTVTMTALLPQVLKRASTKYPNSQSMRQYLDQLYGANFDMDVVKKGEYQIISITLEIANEKYLSDQTPLLARGIEFLGEVLQQPFLEDGGFSKKYVDMEKETLKKKMDGIIDNKMHYANLRVAEEMCANEPYRLLKYGKKEEIDGITPQALYTYYRQLLEQNPIDIYVVGDVEKQQVMEEINRHLSWERPNPVSLRETQVVQPVKEEKQVIDRMNVTQGKLNIGCRTQISYQNDEYVHLLMYNGILGGFTHSKLFINVREKASLAYYAVSRLELHKGIMMIMSGIEFEKYDQALDIIKKQLQLMKEGEISDQELNQTKATLSNQFKNNLDSAQSMIDFAYNGEMSGRKRVLEDVLQQIEQTTIADIQKVAEKVELDTIYFLRNKEGE